MKVVRLFLDVERFVRHDEVVAEVEELSQEIVVVALRLYHFIGSHVDFFYFHTSLVVILSNGHKTFAGIQIIILLLSKTNGAQDQTTLMVVREVALEKDKKRKKVHVFTHVDYLNVHSVAFD